MLHPGQRWWWWLWFASHRATTEWWPHHLTPPCTRHCGSPCTWVTTSGPVKSLLSSPPLSPFLGPQGDCLVAITSLAASWDALTLSHRSLSKLGFDSLLCLVLLNRYSLHHWFLIDAEDQTKLHCKLGRGGSSWTVTTSACKATSIFCVFLTGPHWVNMDRDDFNLWSNEHFFWFLM
jgi:hypothetical protein